MDRDELTRVSACATDRLLLEETTSQPQTGCRCPEPPKNGPTRRATRTAAATACGDRPLKLQATAQLSSAARLFPIFFLLLFNSLHVVHSISQDPSRLHRINTRKPHDAPVSFFEWETPSYPDDERATGHPLLLLFFLLLPPCFSSCSLSRLVISLQRFDPLSRSIAIEEMERARG